ncbi:MAG: hypothetical protein M3081_08520 [Gemmatimonadota bacterium]|nr:hypothetical protein [Gemmatimonadota bacterium]
MPLSRTTLPLLAFVFVAACGASAHVEEGGALSPAAEDGVAIFAPGVVSSALPEFSISFTPDGKTLFFNRVSSDGLRVYLSSDRPRPSRSVRSLSTWYVERTSSGWSDPIGQGEPLNSDSTDSTRTDVLVNAVRTSLATHATTVQQTVARHLMALGVVTYTRKMLERMREQGKTVAISVVGVVVIGSDVTPELALATITSIKVHGVFRASDEVKAALKDRME